MPSYYIPQKNRCYISCTPGYRFPFFLCKPISSSLRTTNLKSSELAKQYQNIKFDNCTKRGSGGNSYEAYLANKRGQRIIYQCKNDTCWKECNPNTFN